MRTTIEAILAQREPFLIDENPEEAVKNVTVALCQWLHAQGIDPAKAMTDSWIEYLRFAVQNSRQSRELSTREGATGMRLLTIDQLTLASPEASRDKPNTTVGGKFSLMPDGNIQIDGTTRAFLENAVRDEVNDALDAWARARVALIGLKRPGTEKPAEKDLAKDIAQALHNRDAVHGHGHPSSQWISAGIILEAERFVVMCKAAGLLK